MRAALLEETQSAATKRQAVSAPAAQGWQREESELRSAVEPLTIRTQQQTLPKRATHSMTLRFCFNSTCIRCDEAPRQQRNEHIAQRDEHDVKIKVL
jgi:hypothetical protein